MSESIRMKCKILSFDDVYGLTRSIAEKVKESGYAPTTIVGLARGGWVPARLMCDFLGLTDLISLKVEHWVQTGKTKNNATIRYPLTGSLSGKSLLIVDDITDTGKSLTTSVDYLTQFHPKDMRVATMQYIPGSEYRPDYFGEEVEVWTWFVYPWNWIEDTSTLIIRLMSTDKEKAWSARDVGRGLMENFEIRWSNEKIKMILCAMVERDQVGLVEGKKAYYKVKGSKVIEL